MESKFTPKYGDGENLSITPGDAKALPEIRNAEDAGGGGQVEDEILNDSELQQVVWANPEDN